MQFSGDKLAHGHIYWDQASVLAQIGVLDRAEWARRGSGFWLEPGLPMADKVYAVAHSDAEWRRILTADQYDVMRAHGTEAPGSCALLQEKRPGQFSCVGCGQPLFEIASEI